MAFADMDHYWFKGLIAKDLDKHPEKRETILEVLDILEYNIIKDEDVPHLFFTNYGDGEIIKCLNKMGYEKNFKTLWKHYIRKNEKCQHMIMNVKLAEANKKNSTECVKSQKWSVRNVIQKMWSKLLQAVTRLI